MVGVGYVTSNPCLRCPVRTCAVDCDTGHQYAGGLLVEGPAAAHGFERGHEEVVGRAQRGVSFSDGAGVTLSS